MSASAFPRFWHWLSAAAVLGMLSLLVVSAPAQARSYSVAPASAKRGALVFRIAGVPAARVRAAHLRIGSKRRKVRVGAVRAAARRGVLKIRVPRARRRKARLVLRISDAQTASGPRLARRRVRPSAPAPAPAPTAPSAPTGGTQQTSPAPQTPSEGTPTSLPAPSLPPAAAKYVSPNGSDSNPGTAASPWRTLSKAISAAAPGDTVVLREGTYGAPGTKTGVSASGTAAAPITFTGFPGEGRPVIQGYVRVTGSHLRFSGIIFDGPTGAVDTKTSSNPGGEEVQVSIMYGSDVEVSGSEIRDNAWHAGIYVYDSTDVRVLGNWIHDNGDRSQPSQANLDHGIYWSKGSGLVANNVIERNLTYGVQLYPDANAVTVGHNTIVGNGKGGVILAEKAAGNRLVNNVVANNASYGIRTYGLTGSGNVAQSNLLWHNGSDFYGDGLAQSGNAVADPRFAGAGNYHLQGSSPAIDHALSGVGPAVDFDGVARPTGGAPDIGAYEAG
jgi:parallel beta helix pectate lyase-like protein/pectate lyase-like protein